MAPERLLGREPVETHTTAHPDGSVTVTTVVREPEWSDLDRERVFDAWDDAQERCPDCGRPLEECSTPPEALYPFRRVCYVTAAREVAQRRWEKLIEKAPADANGFKPGDGVTIGVAKVEIHPDDDFLNVPHRGLSVIPTRTDGGE